jgi:N6-adenosine-specific RNA methylase IME4
VRTEAGTLAAGKPVHAHNEQVLVIGQKTRELKAEAAKVGKSTVQRGDTLAANRPDLAEKVRLGEVRPSDAHRLMNKDKLKGKVAELPDGKYRIIYADPPWQYSDTKAFSSAQGIAAETNYPTMSVAELSTLDVKSLAGDDSVLFCWATFPLLEDALTVVKSWGFKYKTAFVWDKVRPNFGNYHNATAELLLVCTRGSGVPETDKREDQVQVVERTGRHSEKPEHFRDMIDRLYPTGNRIELFRRGDVPAGWETWGNEAD